VLKQLSTIQPVEIDEAIITLRFKHYQQRLMDRINRVLMTRKQIKMRQQAREQLASILNT